MVTIHKYPFSVTDDFTKEMPEKAQIFCVQMQQEVPCIWAMVDTSLPFETREFSIKTTMQAIDITERLDYIGTFQTSTGDSVWHLFERK